MEKKRFSEEQILGYLKAAEAGTPIQSCASSTVSVTARVLHWRKKYGGMSVSEAKRLRELETENGKLRSCWPRRCSHPRRREGEPQASAARSHRPLSDSSGDTDRRDRTASER
jgi:putative transposase